LLKKIAILRERVVDGESYPFSIPVIRCLEELTFRSRICFFTGENGTGKSSLLEAIAAHYGFGREGGNRNFQNDSTDSNHSVDALVRALRLSFDRSTGAGYFLRAESFFNCASYIDEIGMSDFYGGRSLHARSHGETFLTLLELKFQRDGLFLLDEPEAALSPLRQLSFIVLMHDVLRKFKDAQFIVSTHSPLLLGYPEAQILSFDDGHIHEIEYEETAPIELVRRFVNDREGFLEELLHCRKRHCSSRRTMAHSGEAVAEIAEKPDEKNGSRTAYRVLYDGQCEICQACVSWLKALDRENKTICLPISLEFLSAVDSRLQMDECLRQLNVVTPEGEIHVGWDAVACLARLFPSTWLIGVLGQRFPFRNAGRLLYGFVAENRYCLSKCRGGACRVVKPEAVRRQARLGAFWSCYTMGSFISVASGPVGGHQSCDAKNNYFRPDVPPALTC
jgi:predicted ATPase/predicted DCC family thiol-disulfide oxidoreductase YuxK